MKDGTLMNKTSPEAFIKPNNFMTLNNKSEVDENDLIKDNFTLGSAKKLEEQRTLHHRATMQLH